MLKNFWYVAEESVNIKTRPRKIRLLGQDLALFRRPSDGQVVALSDTCVHRYGSLSGGKVVGDCLRCPFHGWNYDATGACTRIPSNPPGATIPKRARVDSYPVIERFGWVWVFLGDLAEPERPSLPSLPEYGQPEWRAIYGQYTWNAHYTRLLEVGPDFSHVPFVHPRTIGDIEGPERQSFDLRVVGDTVSVSASFAFARGRGLSRIIRRAPSVIKAKIDVMMPNLIRAELTGHQWHTVLLDSYTPVDENTTILRFIHLRRFLRSRWADLDLRRRLHKVHVEDKRVVEDVSPNPVPSGTRGELSVADDAGGLAYRQLRQKYIDMGYQIDSKAAKRSIEETGRPLAIPSPLRRAADLGKAWVFDEVTTVAPREATPVDDEAEPA